MNKKNILITGSEGFIGSNLSIKLIENGYQVYRFSKKNNIQNLKSKIDKADFIFHLAGINRSNSKAKFAEVNVNLTEKICEYLLEKKKKIPIFFSSSSKVEIDRSIYSRSKKKAEKILKIHAKKNYPVIYARIPNVYGKWCKPNYNSFVTTCCYNLSRNLKIKIKDESKNLTLVYIDDLIDQMITLINKKNKKSYFELKINKIDKVKVGKIIKLLTKINNDRCNLILMDLRKRLISNLYSTYISYLPKKKISYNIISNRNHTGSFAEFLKGKSFGQISTLFIKPGKVRGNHYHHSKVEKFLVVKGKAKFKFQSILNLKDKFDIFSSHKKLKVIETIPGFTHNIKNVGNTELVTLIWSNQIFNKLKPDTKFKEIR